MIPPMVELTAVIPAEKDLLYPALVIAGITKEPTVAVSATTEPFMPAKKRLTNTLACARLPLNLPMILWLNSTSRSVMVALVINSPVNIKKGIAVNGIESIALNICAGISSSGAAFVYKI